jgi:hypothetical protein
LKSFKGGNSSSQVEPTVRSWAAHKTSVCGENKVGE